MEGLSLSIMLTIVYLYAKACCVAVCWEVWFSTAKSFLFKDSKSVKQT